MHAETFLPEQKIVWDAHGCPPFAEQGKLCFLDRYLNSGVNYLSLNVGFDSISYEVTLNLINRIKKWVDQNNEKFQILSCLTGLADKNINQKLFIGFDLEGTNLLNESFERLETLYSLGVRQIAFTYNNSNSAGGGCLDDKTGLSKFGHKLVQACNRLGITIDCSHSNYRTSMDIMNCSQYPVIFSHSNSASLCEHPRNIIDEQIHACATQNGVIGINGIGIFLGNNNTSSNRIVEHIDYIVQKVGIDHVGLGLDCTFDDSETRLIVENNPTAFPKHLGFHDVKVAQPEQFLEIEDILIRKGYSDKDIYKILGGNFLRIAYSNWIEK